jgi:hypothetical protein
MHSLDIGIACAQDYGERLNRIPPVSGSLCESRFGNDTCTFMQVTGFVFLDEDAVDYTPPPDLAAFLAPPNEPPVYIGFGSLVLTVLGPLPHDLLCYYPDDS